MRLRKPDQKALAAARDQFRALLERKTKEAEWQMFFAHNPYVLSMSLPLRLEPSDIVPMARPGRADPDFVFYPQEIRPVPFYGIIELKRPDTKIATVTRSNIALLSRDAETAIQQVRLFGRNPGDLVPIEGPDKMLFLGNRAHLFVIMGTSREITEKLGIEIYTEMIRQRLPDNLQIIPYDTLLGRFEAILPQKLLFLVPAQETDEFEFETVTLDEYGSVRSRRSGKANQVVDRLAPGTRLESVEIPGGTFIMGAPTEEQDSNDGERPQHEVTVSPFLMGKFAVTQAQWRVVAAWPKVDRDLNGDPSRFKGDDRPVEEVSWKDAVEFCARLSRQTGKTYRLPTEAEWEYACRAGTKTPFAFGETITAEFVNYSGNPYRKTPKGAYRGETVPMGSLGVANRFGLYDMHGNVWEWCQDWYAVYQPGAVTDPTGPVEGRYRVLRGGSWYYDGRHCRSACRNYLEPGFRVDCVGFRVVVVPRTR